MRELLSRALDKRKSGVHILLYGPPGTGKTEFAKVLAREIGADLRAVGETDDDGGEPSRRERLAELTMASRMLGQAFALPFSLAGAEPKNRNKGVPSGSTKSLNRSGTRKRGTRYPRSSRPRSA